MIKLKEAAPRSPSAAQHPWGSGNTGTGLSAGCTQSTGGVCVVFGLQVPASRWSHERWLYKAYGALWLGPHPGGSRSSPTSVNPTQCGWAPGSLGSLRRASERLLCLFHGVGSCQGSSGVPPATFSPGPLLGGCHGRAGHRAEPVHRVRGTALGVPAAFMPFSRAFLPSSWAVTVTQAVK